MVDYPRELILESPLLEFVEHCEVYCSGGCCGLGAFEVHPALIIRKVADLNLLGSNGAKLFRAAQDQVKMILDLIESTDLKSLNEEIPIWGSDPDLPKFWVPEQELMGWFKSWHEAFLEASKYHGLNQKLGSVT